MTLELAIAVVAGCPVVGLHAQIAPVGDMLSGRVVDASGAPIEDAEVRVISLASGLTRITRTSARGQYTIAFPEACGRYEVRVRRIGMTPARFVLERRDETGHLSGNVQLDAIELGRVVP